MQEKLLPSMEFLQMQSVFANAGKSYVPSIEFLQMQEKVMCLR